jgi:hypothetical protein
MKKWSASVSVCWSFVDRESTSHPLRELTYGRGQEQNEITTCCSSGNSLNDGVWLIPKLFADTVKCPYVMPTPRAWQLIRDSNHRFYLSISLTRSDLKFGSKELIFIGFNVCECHITCLVDGEFWRVNPETISSRNLSDGLYTSRPARYFTPIKLFDRNFYYGLSRWAVKKRYKPY